MTETMTAVLKYAELGFACVPCSGKKPTIKNWQHKGSKDAGQLAEWFATPDTNVGIVCGSVSGIFVLDVDGEKGNDSLRELEQKHGLLPVTLTATTGNGEHRYFKYPGHRVKNSTGKLGVGLDVRGDHGLVIAPPSLHKSGKPYQWIDEHAAIATAPAWLLSMLTEEDVPDGETIPKGERNPKLFAHVCELFKTYESKDDVLRLALAFNAQRCRPPEEESKVADVVERVSKTHRPLSLKLITKKKRNPLRWFPFDCYDFLADQHVSALTPTQLGWRTRLVAFAWTNRGRLLNDPVALAKLASAPKKKFDDEIHAVLFDFEAVEENGVSYLVQPELAEMHAEKMAAYEQKRLAGLERARQREKERVDKQLPEERSRHENCDSRPN